MMSQTSLVDLILNKLIVIKVLSMVDEDTCHVTLPMCEHNRQQIPQLARSLSLCLSVCECLSVCLSNCLHVCVCVFSDAITEQ